MKSSIPAIIFAGGKSSRMGQDKALLPFGDCSTLAEFQHQKLSVLFNTVYISAKENKFDFACSVIKDIYEESSPLVGIISLFETLKSEEIFILSVDAPFVDKHVIEKILTYKNHASDAIIAQSPSGIQPLCGIYKKSILPMAYRQLNKKNHKLTDLLQAADTFFVMFEEDKPFTNLNHPHEYQEATKTF